MLLTTKKLCGALSAGNINMEASRLGDFEENVLGSRACTHKGDKKSNIAGVQRSTCLNVRTFRGHATPKKAAPPCGWRMASAAAAPSGQPWSSSEILRTRKSRRTAMRFELRSSSGDRKSTRLNSSH